MKAYYRITVISITLLSCLFSKAQGGSITGRVYDMDGEAMSFANVLLLHPRDSILVKGGTTDDEGIFLLERIPKGNYLLKISLLGFRDYSSLLQVDGVSSLELGNITLNFQNEELEGVDVVGRKNLYQQKSDRLIINVGSLPTFSGNNALQVLQKAPGVVVQESLNSISLNNKGGVLIMINDRVSRIPMSTLIQQLKGMRAENIDHIELIYQPGAKYDAHNAAGIIHIVMKENTMYGTNGRASLTAGMGQREKVNGSMDLNYRNDRLNLYGNITGFHSRSPLMHVNHYREYEYQGNQYNYENQVVNTNPQNYSLGINLGADFEINKNNIVGAMFGFSKSKNMSGNDFTSTSRGAINGIPNSESEYLIDMDNPNSNNFVNVNYYLKLNENSSLNIDLDRVALDVQNSSELSNVNPNVQPETTWANRNSKFRIFTAKGDYKWETTSGDKLETGIKGTFNNSDTDSKIRNKEEGVWVEDESFRTKDEIGEMILAAYGSYQKKWSEKWESELGLRLEYYDYELADELGDNDFAVSYTNLFPVARTSYAIDSSQTLTLSFNRRIDRPDFTSLAGYYAMLDPSLIVTSNTRLRPSFTNAIRLAYNYRSFLVSAEVNRTKGAIAFYNTVIKEDNVQISIPINFDSMAGILLSASFPIKVGRIWTMNWYWEGAYNNVKDASNRPLPFEKGLFTTTVQLNNVFEFGNSWTANLDGRYMSPYLSGDQEQYLHPYLDFGITKKFKNESSLTFSIQDITATSGIIEWEYDQPELGIRTFGDNDWSERVFLLTYTFSFGNQKVKEKRNRAIGSQEERNRM